MKPYIFVIFHGEGVGQPPCPPPPLDPRMSLADSGLDLDLRDMLTDYDSIIIQLMLPCHFWATRKIQYGVKKVDIRAYRTGSVSCKSLAFRIIMSPKVVSMYHTIVVMLDSHGWAPRGFWDLGIVVIYFHGAGEHW